MAATATARQLPARIACQGGAGASACQPQFW